MEQPVFGAPRSGRGPSPLSGDIPARVQFSEDGPSLEELFSSLLTQSGEEDAHDA